MKNFGRQLLGSKLGKFGARSGKKAARGILSSKEVAPVLSRIPNSRRFLFDKGLFSLSRKSVKSSLSADRNLATKQATRKAKATIGRPDFFPGISKMNPTTKRLMGTGALLGIAGAGFVSGIDNKNQVSNAVYDLAFNDPDYDKRVLGKKMGVRSLLAPVPGEFVNIPGTNMPMKALTRQTYSDAWRASRKNAPRVDGSIAFGMYNARLG